MRNPLSYLVLICFSMTFSCQETKKQNENKEIDELKIFDNHVHIMSPSLIKDWKDLGIPFSKSENYYTNIDTILKTNKADHINLVGMSYVYGNEEFYQGNDEYQRVKQENDYLFSVSQMYDGSVTPFFAVDPLKEYALDEIKRCLSINQRAGLKLHFSTSQVYLTEPEHLRKVKPIFEFVSQNNVPVLLHIDNWHPKFGKPDIEILADSILANIEPINLTIAHFGSSGGFNEKTKNVIDAFVTLFSDQKISDKHTILFDISGVALDKDSDGVKKLTKAEFKELKIFCNKIGYDKIVFGTDYPLYNANEYIEILTTRLNLSPTELEKIMK